MGKLFIACVDDWLLSFIFVACTKRARPSSVHETPQSQLQSSSVLERVSFRDRVKGCFYSSDCNKKFCLLWHKYSSKTFRGKGALLRAQNQSVILIRLKEIILNGSSFTVKCIRMSAGKGQQKINKKPHFRCLPATTTDKICPPLE